MTYIATQEQDIHDMLNFILASEEDCALAPQENLEPNTAGLKSLRTRGLWHKSLGKSRAAQIKERPLSGHILCSEEIQKIF